MMLIVNSSPYADMSGYGPRAVNSDHIITAEWHGGELQINLTDNHRLITNGEDADEFWAWLRSGAVVIREDEE